MNYIPNECIGGISLTESWRMEHESMEHDEEKVSVAGLIEVFTLDMEVEAALPEPKSSLSFKAQMLSILAERLCHDERAIVPIKRLLLGPISAFFAYQSSDPGEALDDALRQIKSILKRRKLSGRSQDPEMKRQAIIRHLLRKQQHRLSAYLGRVTAIKQDFACRTCSSPSCQDIRDKLFEETGMLYGFLDFPTSLPLKVRKVVFDNELLRVMEFAPIEELRKIDWESLLGRAEHDLQSLDLWVKPHQDEFFALRLEQLQIADASTEKVTRRISMGL